MNSTRHSEWEMILQVKLDLINDQAEVLHSIFNTKGLTTDVNAFLTYLRTEVPVCPSDLPYIDFQIETGHMMETLQKKDLYSFTFRCQDAGKIVWYLVDVECIERVHQKPSAVLYDVYRQPVVIHCRDHRLPFEIQASCFEGFTKIYDSMMVVDVSHNSYFVYMTGARVDTKDCDLPHFTPTGIYALDHLRFVDTYVHEADRELFSEHTCLEGYRMYLKNMDDRDIFFARMHDGHGWKWFEITTVRIQGHEDDFLVMYWIRNMGETAVDNMQENTLFRQISTQLEQASSTQLRSIREHADFLNTFSHMIRTPLNSIHGFLDLLEEKTDDRALKAICIERIRESTDFLLRQLTCLCDEAEMEAGRLEFEHMPFELFQLLDECSHLIQAQYGHTLDLQMIHDNITQPFFLSGSTRHLSQIMLYVFHRAVSACGGCGKLTMHVSCMKEKADIVTMRFVMDVEEKPGNRYPVSFHDMSRNEDIIRKTIALMRGTLTISDDDHHLHLILDFDRDSIYHPVGDQQLKGGVLKVLKVMVVDDQELNRAFLQIMLEGMGVETVCASGGHSAVELFETNGESFDCILMDIMMPGLNGFETCRMIRRSRKKNADTIPVIAVSANAYSDTRTGAILAGMNDFLLKPVERDQLRAMLVRYCYKTQR